MARMHAAVLAGAALLLLSLIPGCLCARSLAGTGPSYWADAARYPLHYPAAAAAAEGFVVSPMGGQTYCNARLVKPVCAAGIWLQSRCVAELQGLQVEPDSACPPGRDVFAGVPVASAAPRTLTHPIPVTAADLKKYADKGLVFRGIADSKAAAGSSRTGLVEAGSSYWYSAAPGGAAPASPK